MLWHLLFCAGLNTVPAHAIDDTQPNYDPLVAAIVSSIRYDVPTIVQQPLSGLSASTSQDSYLPTSRSIALEARQETLIPGLLSLDSDGGLSVPTPAPFASALTFFNFPSSAAVATTVGTPFMSDLSSFSAAVASFLSEQRASTLSPASATATRSSVATSASATTIPQTSSTTLLPSSTSTLPSQTTASTSTLAAAATASPTETHTHDSSNHDVAIGVGVGVPLGCLFLMLIAFLIYRYKRKQQLNGQGRKGLGVVWIKNSQEAFGEKPKGLPDPENPFPIDPNNLPRAAGGFTAYPIADSPPYGTPVDSPPMSRDNLPISPPPAFSSGTLSSGSPLKYSRSKSPGADFALAGGHSTSNHSLLSGVAALARKSRERLSQSKERLAATFNKPQSPHARATPLLRGTPSPAPPAYRRDPMDPYQVLDPAFDNFDDAYDHPDEPRTTYAYPTHAVTAGSYNIPPANEYAHGTHFAAASPHGTPRPSYETMSVMNSAWSRQAERAIMTQPGQARIADVRDFATPHNVATPHESIYPAFDNTGAAFYYSEDDDDDEHDTYMTPATHYHPVYPSARLHQHPAYSSSHRSMRTPISPASNFVDDDIHPAADAEADIIQKHRSTGADFISPGTEINDPLNSTPLPPLPNPTAFVARSSPRPARYTPSPPPARSWERRLVGSRESLKAAAVAGATVATPPATTDNPTSPFAMDAPLALDLGTGSVRRLMRTDRRGAHVARMEDAGSWSHSTEDEIRRVGGDGDGNDVLPPRSQR